ncbi:MAG TPA: hypothetical protein PKC59_15165, partial [Burkholderiaceae bacterium]|nr:hypothetical protein [Burkholderiaceae bacterium]
MPQRLPATLSALSDLAVERRSTAQRQARLATISLLMAAVLAACGGGGDGSTGSSSGGSASTASASTGESPSRAVSLADTADGLQVSIATTSYANKAGGSKGSSGSAANPGRSASSPDSGSGASASDSTGSSGDQATVDHAWTTMRYAVTANVTAGASSGQALQGALVLRGELQDDGSTKLSGRWVTSPLSSNAASATALAQQLQAIESSSTLRSDYRSQVAALVTSLQIKLGSNGSISSQTLDSDTGRAALAEFSRAYNSATDTYVANYDNLMSMRGNRGSRGASTVSGTMAANGTITL